MKFVDVIWNNIKEKKQLRVKADLLQDLSDWDIQYKDLDRYAREMVEAAVFLELKKIISAKIDKLALETLVEKLYSETDVKTVIDDSLKQSLRNFLTKN